MTFLELLDRLSIPYLTSGHEHCRDGWAQMDCPWCSPGWEHYRLGYNLSGNYFHCWGCGYHSVVSVLIEYTRKEFKEIKELLEGIEQTRFERQEVKVGGKLILPKGVGPLLPAHRKYLKQRRLDPERMEQLWQIQGIGIATRLQWRIFIPVHFQGEVVSWTTRSIGERKAKKYLTASKKEERVFHKHILYGEDACGHTAVVNEGPLDVWSIGPGAVATLGTGFTRRQVVRLARFPRRVICFDATEEGQMRARELCNLLEPFPGDTLNVTLDHKDANECLQTRAGRREIRQLRRLFLKDRYC